VVKYCSGDRATLEISVNNTVEGSELVLVTENQASVERLKDADERLRAGEAAEDPVAHFDKLVRDTLNSPDESRLGLGRLRAEADLAVSHSINNDMISIRVRRRVLKTNSGDN